MKIQEQVLEWAAPNTKIEGNVIPGVKVLGFESPSHKRRYPVQVMKKDAAKYEGAFVNLDHVAPGTQRPTASRFGRIRNPRVDEARGLIGDLHFNPGHPLAGAVKWAAENDPSQYAMSHVADLSGRYGADRWFETESIDKVHSVDVVSNGGTTASLFESAASEGDPTMELTSMTREQLQAARQDLKILSVTEAAANDQALKTANEKIVALEGTNATLKAELEALKAANAKSEKDSVRLKAIEDAKLPAELVTETFKTLALEATDERFTALLTERKEMAVKMAPTSRSRSVAEGAGTGDQPKTQTTKEFAGFLKSGR